MHKLEQIFATAEGEQAFNDQLHALFETGDLDAAEALLAAELVGMDGELAGICRGLSRARVMLSGWEDLAEHVRIHEGEPVTGVTMAIANELDLAFEKGETHEPYVMLGIYTDEAFAFSAASPADLLAQCRAEAGPAWAGLEEDVELYLEIEGLGRLNTALLFHKQRHFFRDDNPERAPLRYVEYVVGCWWRALRFQQAVAAEYAAQGLPGSIPVVAGMVDMRPELVAVHAAGGQAAFVPRPVQAETDVADMSAAAFIKRLPQEEVEELTGASLRRRFATSPTGEGQVGAKRGLLGRLFGRKELEEVA